MSIVINFVHEDDLSEFIMTQLTDSFGNKFQIANSFSKGGYDYIKKNIKGFNQAAIASTFFVLTDLDKYECPTNLINSWLKSPKNPNLILRVAVREVETWILADVEGFSKYLGISTNHFIENPESLQDPKAFLIGLARKSRKRSIREDLVPLNANAKIGPNYNGRLMEFVFDHWNIDRAMLRSKSLQKTYLALERFEFRQNTK